MANHPGHGSAASMPPAPPPVADEPTALKRHEPLQFKATGHAALTDRINTEALRKFTST